MSPRVLVISNTEFNLSDSNGRVLGTLLVGIDNESKMQFCVNGHSVSSELITDCYKISDRDVLYSVFKKKIKAEKLPVDFVEPNNKGVLPTRRIKRTASTMLARDLLWRASFHKTEFLRLALNFKPDIVFWDYGDSGFMAKMVYDISKRCKSKIVVFAGEDYYFKTWDYFKKKSSTLSYKLFCLEMHKEVKRLFKDVSLCIANTPLLAERFRNEFKCRTTVIMQTAGGLQAGFQALPAQERMKRIVYAGNLGINRHKSIIKIAKALYRIDPDINMEVYGRAKEDVLEKLKKEENIKLMGFVSYREVTEIVRNSLLTIHAESFEPFYRYDLEAAFSTKITDALCSGTPLLMYAPDNLAETKYLIDNKCAFVCTREEDLGRVLKLALYDQESRKTCIELGKKVVEKNHNAIVSQKKVVQLFEAVCEGHA